MTAELLLEAGRRCGPGAIAAANTVGVALNHARCTISVARMGGGVLALLVIAVLLYFAFRYASSCCGRWARRAR